MKVFIVAGESSGDRLGADLMRGLRKAVPGVEFQGVAGPQMQVQGVDSLFDMSELSVMGLVEILPKYFNDMCEKKREELKKEIVFSLNISV